VREALVVGHRRARLAERHEVRGGPDLEPPLLDLPHREHDALGVALRDRGVRLDGEVDRREHALDLDALGEERGDLLLALAERERER
jgi:hypothetical protein